LDYIEQNLIPGEHILYRTRLHWIVLFWHIVGGIFLGLAGFSAMAASVGTIGNKNERSGPLFVFGLVLLATATLVVLIGRWSRQATEIALTNRRVMIRVGRLSKKSVELFLNKVESIGVEQSVWGRILGYGNVVVRGTGGTAEPFEKLASPLEFRRQVQQHMERIQEQPRTAVTAL
jgi:uncharacterized membrane protein YdbT with pleckstrin-like domain